MAVLEWQLANVTHVRDETARVKTFGLELPAWPAHLPGQHVDIRLTADDGYQAQRSYSIASGPYSDAERARRIEITVERVDEGEVSTFLHDTLEIGDRFEVRGPIGGYFVWDGRNPDPLLLVGGGSGIVPLMAMLRHRAGQSLPPPTTLVYSSRTRDDVIYFDELEQLANAADGLRVVHTLTRSQPAGWTGFDRRIDMRMLADVLEQSGRRVDAFVCGPTPLVESVAESLVQLGLPPAQVRTERFGPTGG
jgi:ferredoxin-NADP reductase